MRSTRRWEAVALMAGLVLGSACGGPTPVRPVALPTALPEPTPTPTPIATPTPIPTPTPCADCEPTVTNTNPPVRLTLRLYAVEDPFGATRFNWDPTRGIPVDWVARLDVVGKDVDGSETNGQDDVEFHFSEPPLVKVSGGHTHQRRVKVVDTGDITCWATQHGVRSNDLVLKLVREP